MVSANWEGTARVIGEAESRGELQVVGAAHRRRRSKPLDRDQQDDQPRENHVRDPRLFTRSGAALQPTVLRGLLEAEPHVVSRPPCTALCELSHTTTTGWASQGSRVPARAMV